jgi:hypothetical protein
MQSLEEYRTEYSIWAIANAPLLVSTDIRNLSAIQKEILLAPEVISINQDGLAVAGDLVYTGCTGEDEVTIDGYLDGMAAGDGAAAGGDSDEWYSTGLGVQAGGEGVTAGALVSHARFADAGSAHENSSWYVAAEANACYDPTEGATFHLHGPTSGYEECQSACGANTSCNIYEWSHKSGNCWWRLDGVWKPVLHQGPRWSGCLVASVKGCGPSPPTPAPQPTPVPPPHPGPAPKSKCMTWAKPLESAQGDGVNDTYAVALVNIGDVWANMTVNMSRVMKSMQRQGDGSLVSASFRDVWAKTDTPPGIDTFNVGPHSTRLLKVAMQAKGI